MNLKIELRKILMERYDLIFGIVFFLLYRLFFTWLLWHGRNVPPEPDDSYYYLTSAKHFLNIKTFEEFRLLPFSLWLNFLSLFVHTNLEIAYKINFYIGPVVMFTAVYYFFSKLENSRLIRLLLIMVIALYSGSGNYHGFYWVVESFYQFALFITIFAILVNKNSTKLYLVFPVCLLFIFIHPTSAFLSVTFALYPVTLFLFSKKEALKAFYNLVTILICLGISFFLYVAIGRLFPSSGSPQSFQTQLGLIGDFISGKLQAISFPIIWREYFAIFFNNAITTITYVVMFVFVLYLKKYKLLAIFCSILIVVFLSSFVPYGSRTLGLLWPVTFVIIGYFIVGIWKTLQSSNSQIKLGYLTVIPFVGLFTLATIFNLISISTLNATKNYNWDRSCPLELKDKNIYFTSLEPMNAFSLYGNNESNLHFLSKDEFGNFLSRGNMLAETKNEKLQPSPLSGIESYLASKITRRSTGTSVEYPVNAWTVSPTDLDAVQAALSRNNLHLNKYIDCGHFQVLIINDL